MSKSKNKKNSNKKNTDNIKNNNKKLNTDKISNGQDYQKKGDTLKIGKFEFEFEFEKSKIADFVRKFITFFAFGIAFYYCIEYVNSGTDYDQAVSFRPLCMALAVAVLSLMPLKTYLNLYSVIYIPICYVFMHFAYQKEWIYDVCEYQHADVIRMGKIVALLWGIAIISIIYDAVKNKGYKRLFKINPFIGGMWLLFLILLACFSGMYYNAWFIIVAFSALTYVICDDTKRNELLKALERAALLSFIYILYKSLRHRPYDTERYLSYFANENTAGMYLACMIALFYSTILGWWRNNQSINKLIRRLVLIFYFVMFGILGSFVIFNYTRTTIMGMGFSFIVLFVIHLIKKENKKSLFLRIGYMFLSVIIFFYPTYLMIRYIPAYINEPTHLCWEINDETSKTRVLLNDPVDSPKYTSIEEYLTLALGKWGIYVDFENKDAEGTPSVEIDTKRDVTNSRGDIWKEYLSRLSVKGHFPGYIIKDERVDEDLLEHTDHITYKSVVYPDNPTDEPQYNLMYHGHNTYIQVAYQYGIIVGALYLIINIGCFICGSIILIKIKDINTERRLTFAVLMLGVTMLAQLTECFIHPAYIICFMLYICVTMVVTEAKRAVFK